MYRRKCIHIKGHKFDIWKKHQKWQFARREKPYIIAYKVQPNDQISVLSSISDWLGQSQSSGARYGAETCSAAHSYKIKTHKIKEKLTIWLNQAKTCCNRKNKYNASMNTWCIRNTCNCTASERERICLLAGRALPKSISIARGGWPFLWVKRTLPGFKSLCAYGGSKLCICSSPAQSWTQPPLSIKIRPILTSL